MYTKKQRHTAVFIALLIAAVTLFSLLFLVKETDHKCAGTDCQICSVIQQAKQILRHLGGADFHSTEGLLIVQYSMVLSFCALLFLPCFSRVKWKVRLDH